MLANPQHKSVTVERPCVLEPITRFPLNNDGTKKNNLLKKNSVGIDSLQYFLNRSTDLRKNY